MEPIASRLREHTRPLHDRVEKAVDIPSRCASLEAYRSLLARMLGFYAPFEASQSRLDWREAGLDFEARRKAHLLRADLSALGLSEPAIDALPLRQRLPEPGSLAAGLGHQYVLEGATLGGQILAREIERSLGLSPGAGGSFYAGYGERTGSMWRGFCSAANSYCGDDPRRHEDALAGAVQTFEAFEAWLLGGAGEG